MFLKFLWALVLAILPRCAQFETSEVLGTVRDSSSSPVPPASVTLLNQDTGVETKASTDKAGNYDFFNVKAEINSEAGAEGPLNGRNYADLALLSTNTDVSGLSTDYRGQAFQWPDVSGAAVSQSSSQMINNYFAGYTFTTPPPTRHSGIWGGTRFARRISSNGIWRSTGISSFEKQ